MRSATRLLLVAAAFVACAGLAHAQDPNVTFQVDMNPFITTCQFDPATDVVSVSGTINGWNTDANPITDADANGVYEGTIAVPAGDIAYKFVASGLLGGYEDGDNRLYTVTADPNQTIPVASFNKPATDLCTVQLERYELTFTVDMNVQIASGDFDPATDVVYVAGAFQGWNAGGNPLVEDALETGVYTALITTDSLIVPSTQAYKFITSEAGAPTGWESGGDRLFELSGTEPDSDADGLREYAVPRRFFNDISFEDILQAPATVRFEVDLRPAFYALADNGSIPGNSEGGDPQTAISYVSINGPIASQADENVNGLEDWAAWGPTQLGAIPERRLRDDGTAGDVTANDSIFTLTYNYPAGTPRRLIGKFGADGYDNEAGFGNDQNAALNPGSQTFRFVFGAIRAGDGTFTDNNGPGGPIYDPYIVINNNATPPTATVVRNDGTDTAGEHGPEVPASLVLSQNYPNPFNPSTRFTYTLAQTQPVTVRVYDLTGRTVATLVQGVQTAGAHEVLFNASGLASGVYLYRLETPGQVITRQMVLVK